MRDQSCQNATSEVEVIPSIYILLDPQFIVFHQLVCYKHKRPSSCQISSHCIERSSWQHFFAYLHVHCLVAHLCTYFTHVDPSFEETLAQHSQEEVFLPYDQKNHISDQDRQIPFEKTQVGGQCFYSIGLKTSNIMYLVLGHDPSFDCIDGIGDKMGKCRQYAGRNSLIQYAGFLLDLGYMCFSMCLMVLPHDERFLEQLEILRIVLHMCQLDIIKVK